MNLDIVKMHRYLPYPSKREMGQTAFSINGILNVSIIPLLNAKVVMNTLPAAEKIFIQADFTFGMVANHEIFQFMIMPDMKRQFLMMGTPGK